MKEKKIWPSVLIIIAINIIGIYFVRTNDAVKNIVSSLYLLLFFVVFIGSLIISGIKNYEDQFWGEVAFMSRFCMIAFIPIFIASQIS